MGQFAPFERRNRCGHDGFAVRRVDGIAVCQRIQQAVSGIAQRGERGGRAFIIFQLSVCKDKIAARPYHLVVAGKAFGIDIVGNNAAFKSPLFTQQFCYQIIVAARPYRAHAARCAHYA